jgi:hypothetical protein
MALPRYRSILLLLLKNTARLQRSFYDVATGLVPTLCVVMRRKFVLAY